MVISHARSLRRVSGGKKTWSRKRRKYELGRRPVNTKIGQRKLKTVRTKGSNKKEKLLSVDQINVLDKKTSKITKVKIENVLKNPANRHFVRRNILTKGTIIKTSLGDARITSRPGQTGTMYAVLV